MSQEQNPTGQNMPNQTIIIQQETNKSNGIGTAGFVISLITLFLSWIPVLGWILWLLGAVFSFVGIFKEPKGLAIAGLAISFIGLIIMIVLAGIIATAIGLGGM